MKLLQKSTFEKTLKKLNSNAKQAVYKAVENLVADPSIGKLKKGDLANIRVYKFKMVNQLTLLAYIYDENTSSLTLLMLGSHQNFYRDLKIN